MSSSEPVQTTIPIKHPHRIPNIPRGHTFAPKTKIQFINNSVLRGKYPLLDRNTPALDPCRRLLYLCVQLKDACSARHVNEMQKTHMYHRPFIPLPLYLPYPHPAPTLDTVSCICHAMYVLHLFSFFQTCPIRRNTPQ